MRRLEETLGALQEYLGLTPAVLRAMDSEIGQLARHGQLQPASEVVKHYSSKLMAQDVFVRLHGFLFDHHFLPLSEWGRERGRHHEADFHNVVIQRIGFKRFLAKFGSSVPAGSTCLGWDDLEYVREIRGCADAKAWTFSYQPRPPDRPLLYTTAQRRIIGDMGAPDLRAPVEKQFDAILCGMVFEHVKEPSAMAARLFQLLRPGGVLIYYAPFLTRYHGAPSDYYRYTNTGAQYLLTTAGFRITTVRTVGNDAVASGWLLGFGSGDFSSEKLSAPSLLRKLKDEQRPNNTLYIATGIVAHKPAQAT